MTLDDRVRQICNFASAHDVCIKMTFDYEGVLITIKRNGYAVQRIITMSELEAIKTDIIAIILNKMVEGIDSFEEQEVAYGTRSTSE